tara:strand:- start:1061 stop:1900 length:840 start_codon:yes stop_codon:yes gene_type:complete
MKNILLILFTGAIMFPFVIFSQSTADKKVQAGLTFNAGANFLSPSSNKIEVEGGGSVLSIGLNLHSALKSSQNLAIATGLEFDFGKNSYKPNSSDALSYTYVDYLQDDVILTNEEAADADTYETMQLVSRKVSTTKLTIPLMLLFRTNFIGDFRYFGKFGIRNSFLLSHNIADDGFATTLGIPNGTEVSTSLMRSPGEMFIYNGSIGLSAGAEWNFVGSTCLVLEAGYYYGITPFFIDRKDSNKTMYNIGTELILPPARNYYSASARQNQLIFKLSILF